MFEPALTIAEQALTSLPFGDGQNPRTNSDCESTEEPSLHDPEPASFTLPDAPTSRSRVRLRAYMCMAEACSGTGDLEQSILFLQRGLAQVETPLLSDADLTEGVIAEPNSDAVLRASLLARLGSAFLRTKRLDDALAMFSEALFV
jgi:hypothetical protein